MISPSIRSHFVRIKHALTVFAYAPYPGVKSRISTTMRVCVCVCMGGGLLWRGKPPLSSLSFVQSLGDSHHQKSMCVRAYVRLCVCQGFVRQISPACAALVLLNQASITRPLWIMQGRLLLTYSTGCSCWCVLSVRARVTGRSFFLLANATGQFFDVPPLGPLNLVSDTGTPTLILVFLSVCVCARECVRWRLLQ